MEMLKDYEKKFDNNQLSLHISSRGTIFDDQIPCIKACLYFDPKHSLEAGVESVSGSLDFYDVKPKLFCQI